MRRDDLEILQSTLQDIPEFAFDIIKLFDGVLLYLWIKSECRSTAGALFNMPQGRDFTATLMNVITIFVFLSVFPRLYQIPAC